MTVLLDEDADLDAIKAELAEKAEAEVAQTPVESVDPPAKAEETVEASAEAADAPAEDTEAPTENEESKEANKEE
jgi:hypothetical protein